MYRISARGRRSFHWFNVWLISIACGKDPLKSIRTIVHFFNSMNPRDTLQHVVGIRWGKPQLNKKFVLLLIVILQPANAMQMLVIPISERHTHPIPGNIPKQTAVHGLLPALLRECVVQLLLDLLDQLLSCLHFSFRHLRSSSPQLKVPSCTNLPFENPRWLR